VNVSPYDGYNWSASLHDMTPVVSVEVQAL
jgi:hypothetical protein